MKTLRNGFPKLLPRHQKPIQKASTCRINMQVLAEHKELKFS